MFAMLSNFPVSEAGKFPLRQKFLDAKARLYSDHGFSTSQDAALPVLWFEAGAFSKPRKKSDLSGREGRLHARLCVCRRLASLASHLWGRQARGRREGGTRWRQDGKARFGSMCTRHCPANKALPEQSNPPCQRSSATSLPFFHQHTAHRGLSTAASAPFTSTSQVTCMAMTTTGTRLCPNPALRRSQSCCRSMCRGLTSG
jgi:hypothetical protein